MSRTAATPHVVARTVDPPWLPTGSTATVVRSTVPPAPTGLVRLLLRRDGHALCVPRTDGRLDLPTAAVRLDGSDPDGSSAIRALASLLLPAGTALVPVGHVRNEVPAATTAYPWPAPLCHFTVWTATAPSQSHEIEGSRWLPLGAGSPLGDRHWFPLVDQRT